MRLMACNLVGNNFGDLKSTCVGFFQPSGGTILQIPYRLALGAMLCGRGRVVRGGVSGISYVWLMQHCVVQYLDMYLIGSANSSTVG